VLALKLLLTPLLIGLTSLAGRRWGPRVSGWLIGLPLTSAPVALFLALEQGRPFAAQAAQGVLSGYISLAAFCGAYAWLSFRAGWLPCWLAGWSAFFAITFVLNQAPLPLPLTATLVAGALLLTLRLWPRDAARPDAPRTPAWEIAARMALGAGFVFLLTEAAATLGPRLSGLLSPLPIFATIFAIFTQRFQGPSAARRLLGGVVVSSFAAAVFFVVVAALLVPWGLPATFAAAAAAALLAQGAALGLWRRYTRRAVTPLAP
jgi:hypothetical protein